MINVATLDDFGRTTLSQMFEQLGGPTIFRMAFDARASTFEAPRAGEILVELTLAVRPDLLADSATRAGITSVRIQLDGSDTYRVAAYRGSELATGEATGIYAEELQTFVESLTGLLLTMARPRRAS